MGIILKNSKFVFDELIGTNSFDDFFKNSIRDYYTYGFKSYEEYIKSRQSINNRWKVFNKILGDNWYFDKRADGRNQIVLKTMTIDPEYSLDNLYFLHNLSEAGDHISLLIALNPKSRLRYGLDSLPVPFENLLQTEVKEGKQYIFKDLIDVDEPEYAIMLNWQEQLLNNQYKEIQDKKVRINRQLYFWTPSIRSVVKRQGDKYKNLSNRTKRLYAYGVIGNLKDTPAARNEWMASTWEKYGSRIKRSFQNTTSGNDYWFRSECTLSDMCKTCLEDLKEDRKSFIHKFREMCSFYSQYYPLGIIGTILEKRCEGLYSDNKESKFLFKHNYFQKSLYDYNLIDILIAIENQAVCQIKYTHGTQNIFYEEAAIPLEIRMSVVSGREYVVFYQVAERRIKALRLEFIDKITIFSKVDQIIRKKPGSDKEEQVIIDSKDLSAQLDRAREMLKYLWGTEVNSCIVEDDWKKYLKSYHFDISYDISKEPFIKERLLKENRFLNDNGNITIFPTKELRQWIRSFYVRVSDASDIDDEKFNIAEDVNKMWKLYFDNADVFDTETKSEQPDDYYAYSYQMRGKQILEQEGHAGLFNELFSRYTVVLANAVLQCAGYEKHDFDKVLTELVEKSFDYYDDKERKTVVSELKREAIDRELIDDKGETRVIIPNSDYLSEILPLTKVEVRWLCTILEDPLAEMFFDISVINKIKDWLHKAPYKVTPFKMDVINYYDRYNHVSGSAIRKKTIKQSGCFLRKQINFLNILQDSMEKQVKIKVSFKNRNGQTREIICVPVKIEYSRKDDTFRVWHIDENRKWISKINLPRILKIEQLSDQKYCLGAEQESLNKIYEDTIKKVKFEFYKGSRNLPDRILTEFSAWKKTCTYDITTKKYTITLFYSQQDEKEILIRLMGYGPYIKVLKQKENQLLEELKRRIAKQRDIIQTREFETE